MSDELDALMAALNAGTHFSFSAQRTITSFLAPFGLLARPPLFNSKAAECNTNQSFLLLGQVITPTNTVQRSPVYFNESEFRARVDSALQKVSKNFHPLIVDLYS